MVKIKNVRPGILIIADAGLKLAPGESVDLETLTRQAQKAVDDGLLACIDTAPAAKPEAKPDTKSETKTESRPKGKTAAPAADNKESSKKGKGQPTEEEQPPASEENPEQGAEQQPVGDGQGQLLEADDASK